MKAEIISVGTEILLGQTADPNPHSVSARLPAIGIDLYYHSTVGDNLDRLVDTLEVALRRSDVIIMTGGLGPTEDALTPRHGDPQPPRHRPRLVGREGRRRRPNARHRRHARPALRDDPHVGEGGRAPPR